MRGIVLIAAIGACVALSSCDQDQQQVAQTAPPPAPTCACRATAPQETAAVVQTPAPVQAMHHRHHWRGEHYSNMAWNEHRRWRGGAYSRTDFTQSVQAPYDYVSGSSVSYYESTAYESTARYEGSGYAMHPRQTIAATMTGARLDPWHGYDVDCPQR